MSTSTSTDILYLGFQPDDAAPLMLEEELDAIDKRLASSQNGHALKLHIHQDVGLEDIPGLLARIKPSVFHVSLPRGTRTDTCACGRTGCS
jgi:hypothetical protein